MRRIIALLVVLAAVVPAAAGGTRLDVPPGAIAVVAGEPVPRSDFDALMRRARASYSTNKRPFPRPGSRAFATLKRQAVEYLVTQAMYRVAAAALGVSVTADEIEARRADVIREYYGGSVSRYRRAIRRQGMTDADVRRDIAAQLLSERLFERVTADVTVTDAEVQVYYDTHLAEFTRRESRVVRHILVKTRSLAVRLRTRLLRGESFAALARRYSLDPGSRASGGRLTIQRGQTVAPFDRVAFALRTGAVSLPVRTPFGWHLIQALSAIAPARTASFETVKESIAEQLLSRRREERMAEWIRETRAAYAGQIEYAPGFAP